MHFHALWKAAVKAKMPGSHARAPAARPASNQRTTIEAGLVVHESERESAMRAEAGGNDTYVPPAGSPSQSLDRVAQAGDDLASRHGSTTTTDFGMLSEEEICAVCEGGLEGEFETLHLFDADGRGTCACTCACSVEIICDNCRGLGHIRRVCPSNRNRSRSLDYAIAALQSKKSAVGRFSLSSHSESLPTLLRWTYNGSLTEHHAEQRVFAGDHVHVYAYHEEEDEEDVGLWSACWPLVGLARLRSIIWSVP